MMEVIGVLEEELSIRISDKEVSTLNNVGDLLNLVRDRIPGRLPEPPKGRMPSPAKARGPECWDIAAFPEVRNIEERLEEIERNGLRNPYFHVHDGTARNRSVIDGVEMLNFSSTTISVSPDTRKLSRRPRKQSSATAPPYRPAAPFPERADPSGS